MSKIWISKDGQETPYNELETSHLCNIIEMLKRNAAPHLEKAKLDPEKPWLIYPDLKDLEREMDSRLTEVKKNVDEEPETDAEKRFRLLELN